MTLILGDEEFFEGLLGGLGWVLSAFYFKRAYVGNPIIAGVIGWMLLWFTRKMGMRIYRAWRTDRLDKTSGIKISGLSPLVVFIIFCLAIVLLSWSNISINRLPLSLSNLDLVLLCIASGLIYHIYH